MKTKKTKSHTVPEFTPVSRRGHLPGRGVRHYDGVHSLLCWLAFGSAIALWGVIFGLRLTSLQTVIEQTDASVDQEIAFIYGERVLGATDGTDSQDGAVDEDQSAQTDDAGQDQAVAELVDEIEEERRTKIREMLDLQLPTEIDNPNFPVTFIEPTAEGVEIQVDGEGFSQKKSPFQLPSLAIGKHTVYFRFSDTTSVTQNLEEDIIVIPRAPEWSDAQVNEFRSDDTVAFAGTALPHSTVVLLVGSVMISQQVDADAEGNWEIALTQKLESGDHSAVCFVRKEGYASNFSEPLTFTVGIVEGITSDIVDTDENGNDGGILGTITDVLDTYLTDDNYYYIIGAAGLVAVGLILVLSVLIKSLRSKRLAGAGWVAEDPDSEQKSMASRSEDQPEEKIPLREKFARAGLNVGSLSALTTPGKSADAAAKQGKEDTPKRDESDRGEKPEPAAPVETTQPATKEVPSEKKKTGRKKVYSKEEFLGEFADDVKPTAGGKEAEEKEADDEVSEQKSSKESQKKKKEKKTELPKIQISLTSRKR